MVNAKIVLFMVGTCFILTLFCGCAENEVKSISSNDVTIQSDVADLVEGKIDYFLDDSNEIFMLKVSFILHNIAGKKIDQLKITAEFYDEDNNLLGASEPKYLNNVPIDYKEQFDPNFNVFTYESTDAKNVDHVVIVAVEE